MGFITEIKRYRWAVLGRKKIKKCVKEKQRNAQAIKIILGAGHHQLTSGDWINTDLPQFDVTKSDQWNYIFGALKIDNLLAEHVFEHLTLEQNKIAFDLIYSYLKPKGVFRFAVPDGYHPDKKYIDYVKPLGSGPGSDDHKLLWTIDLINETFSGSKFKIIPREYYSKEGNLVSTELRATDGKILRTAGNSDKQDTEIKNYSSLIIDFVKE
ncbi:hypothetical protein [Aurantibacillus circumpalustris]|uniref:hypothetical protein n=1 Tax=Aurantibacillus circumpalustris TaxID=3036359 RepID=UPI00295BBF1E|nr:hypothetical protein [Aurantibacillus circumpalustris]